MSIGDLARRAGVGIETIRFYERRSLLPEPPRSAAGYRRYGAQDLRRLGFILRAKELGFTLEEIRDLLALRLDAQGTCTDVRRRARAKLADIDTKMRMLQRMRDALAPLVVVCSSDGPTSECPILDAMDPAGEGEVDGVR